MEIKGIFLPLKKKSCENLYHSCNKRFKVGIPEILCLSYCCNNIWVLYVSLSNASGLFWKGLWYNTITKFLVLIWALSSKYKDYFLLSLISLLFWCLDHFRRIIGYCLFYSGSAGHARHMTFLCLALGLLSCVSCWWPSLWDRSSHGYRVFFSSLAQAVLLSHTPALKVHSILRPVQCLSKIDETFPHTEKGTVIYVLFMTNTSIPEIENTYSTCTKKIIKIYKVIYLTHVTICIKFYILMNLSPHTIQPNRERVRSLNLP